MRVPKQRPLRSAGGWGVGWKEAASTADPSGEKVDRHGTDPESAETV